MTFPRKRNKLAQWELPDLQNGCDPPPPFPASQCAGLALMPLPLLTCCTASLHLLQSQPRRVRWHVPVHPCFGAVRERRVAAQGKGLPQGLCVHTSSTRDAALQVGTGVGASSPGVVYARGTVPECVLRFLFQVASVVSPSVSLCCARSDECTMAYANDALYLCMTRDVQALLVVSTEHLNVVGTVKVSGSGSNCVARYVRTLTAWCVVDSDGWLWLRPNVQQFRLRRPATGNCAPHAARGVRP